MRDGRESCYVQELFPCTTTITDVAREGAYSRVTKHRGTPYWIPGDSDSSTPTPRTEEYTDALFPVSCEWIKAIPLDCYPTDLALIHKSCMIKGRNMEKIYWARHPTLYCVRQYHNAITTRLRGGIRSPKDSEHLEL